MADHVHRAALELIGIPFREGGRDFRQVLGGTDCAGVCWEFCRRAGIDARDPWLIIADQWRAQEIGVDAGLRAGGWVLCDSAVRAVGDIGESADAGHVCVYVGGGRALHARRGSVSFLASIVHAPAARWWRYAA